MIRHTVAFTLAHQQSSEEERKFLATARDTLTSIPGVEDFAISRQVSPKSTFRFQFAMTFADQTAYDAYNEHPAHVDFVASRWTREVTAFEELDFVPYS